MVPVAGPSSGGLTDRAAKMITNRNASRSKTNKRIDQERIIDGLLASFLGEQQDPSVSSQSSARARQKTKAIQTIGKDSWSPADEEEVAAAVHGLSLKHRIHLDYELATALQRCFSQLLLSTDRSVQLAAQNKDAQKRRGLDVRNYPEPPIRPDNVSDAVRFLLRLSKPADVTARTAANLLLNTTQANRAQYLTPEQRKQAEKREWLTILVNEPLEGEAWDDNSTDQDNSDLSDWSLNLDDEHRLRMDVDYDSDKEIRKRRNRLAKVSLSLQPAATSVAGFQERELWARNRPTRLELLEDTAGKSASGNSAGEAFTEADAVRESLAVLIGSASALFEERSGKVTFTPSSRQSNLNGRTEQLQEIAKHASTLGALRSFVKSTIVQSVQAVDALTRTPAVEAFAEQLHILLERTALRFSELDADIAVASITPRPAAVLADRYATLTQLLEFVQRETASVLLLSRLLCEMGFTAPTEASAEAAIIRRTYSDRALIDGLQALLGFVHQQNEVAYSDAILADLSTCLLAACRPAWSTVCRLIRRGLPFAILRDHDPLFDDRLVRYMIRHDTSTATSDSTFWTLGYMVRDAGLDTGGEDSAESGYRPPAFLQSIMQDVVTTAKGVGLLRSLGIDALGEVQPNVDLDWVLGIHGEAQSNARGQTERHLQGDESDIADGPNEELRRDLARLTPHEAQGKLQQLLFSTRDQNVTRKVPTSRLQASEDSPQTPLSQPDVELLWHSGRSDISRRASHRLLEPVLGRSLEEHLSPISSIVRKRLIELLSSPATEGGYALQFHLSACHGLYLMQRGAEMTSWLEFLFIDLGRRNGTVRATEHQRLNSGFSDALETHQQRTSEEAWIDANLVRFSTGDEELESTAAVRQRTRIRRLADIQVDYEVPWPLKFAFPLDCMRFYQSMFTTLLQARYSQWKLSSTLKLTKPETVHMRKFWALRRQAQWLVRTLIEYLQRDVLLDGSQRLCSDLQGMVSLDSAIHIHHEALERMELLSFHRLEQARLKELFGVAWRLGVEVVSNYESFIGASSREEDRLARRKLRERRKKRRDKAKRDGAPLGAIAEEDEEEEEEEDDDDEAEAGDGQDDDGFPTYGALGQGGDANYEGEAALDRVTEAFDSASIDASLSADISASWMESETHKRERFRSECERQRKALHRLVEELKVSVDDQIGRIAARAAVQAQDATQADKALQEHNYAREKWQGLLYALAWSDMTY